MKDRDQQPPAGDRRVGPPAHRVVVPADAAGERLDLFLARIPDLGPRSRVKALAQAGALLIDGRRAKAGTSVAPHQVVTILELEPAAIEPPVAAREPVTELVVLYQDSELVVIDKPAGIAVHRPENPRNTEPTVAELAVRQFGPMSLAGGEDRPGIVHRLDKDTTGVMVLARTDEAMHFLKSQFRARTVQKEYLALVYGVPRFDSDWIERNLAPHPRKGERMVVVQDGGREAQTYYEAVERFDGYSLLRCLPKTGRTHQIRVHLQSIGLSLVGDRLYRSRNAQAKALPAAAPDPGRQCLHARRLSIEHPVTRERLEFEVAIPPDIAGLLTWLRAQQAAGPGRSGS